MNTTTGNATPRIDEYLKTLSLHAIRDHYLEEAENAAKAKLSYEEFLTHLVELELLSKIDRSINRLIQLAGFPMIRLLDGFDFSYQPHLDEKLLRELANLRFIAEAYLIAVCGSFN